MKLRCPTWRRIRYVQHQHSIISVHFWNIPVSSSEGWWRQRRRKSEEEGERKKEKREMFPFDLGRSLLFIEFIVCEFAVVDIRLGTQIAHFSNFVFLKITSLSIWKAITLIGNVTSETELWKTSKITTTLPTLSEHMGRITCITSILLMILVQYI